MPFKLKHGEFELWGDDLEIHFKVLEMDESFRRNVLTSTKIFHSITNKVKIRSDLCPDLDYHSEKDEIYVWLWGSCRDKDNAIKKMNIPNLQTQEINQRINRIFEALKEWDIWMDEQNPISDVQKQKNLEYHTRMVSIKGKEN